VPIAGLGHLEEPLRLRGDRFQPLDDMHRFIHPVEGVARIEGNPVEQLLHLEFRRGEAAFGLHDLALGEEPVENRKGEIDARIKTIAGIILIEAVVAAPAGVALEVQAGFVARLGDGDQLLEHPDPAFIVGHLGPVGLGAFENVVERFRRGRLAVEAAARVEIPFDAHVVAQAVLGQADVVYRLDERGFGIGQGHPPGQDIVVGGHLQLVSPFAFVEMATLLGHIIASRFLQFQREQQSVEAR